MDVTKKRNSRILELKEMLLSFQTGFDVVNVAVVFAILGAWKPRQIQLSLRVLEACDSLKLLFTCDLIFDAGVVV